MKKLIQVGLVICLFVSAIAGSVMAPPPALAQAPEQKTVTIIDQRGAQVEIPQPLERVVIFNIWNAELVRALGGWESIVGMDLNTVQDTSYWPGFDTDHIVGPNQREPDYEKIVSLKPQVVIFAYSWAAWAEAEEKLSPFGIKVVVFDSWDPRMYVSAAATFGLMFDKSERAQELIAFNQKYLNLVKERVSTVENRKRVYYESYGEVNDYKTALSGPGGGWHEMIVNAGGINIFGDIDIAQQPTSKGSTSAFEIDPEEILVRNPQVILKMDPGKKAIAISTIFSPPEPGELKATWERLANRAGWSELDALKNNQFYVFQPFILSTGAKMIGTCYLAKLLYPELFADLDVEAVMKEWIEQYQGLPYSGGYVYPAQ